MSDSENSMDEGAILRSRGMRGAAQGQGRASLPGYAALRQAAVMNPDGTFAMQGLQQVQRLRSAGEGLGLTMTVTISAQRAATAAKQVAAELIRDGEQASGAHAMEMMCKGTGLAVSNVAGDGDCLLHSVQAGAEVVGLKQFRYEFPSAAELQVLR